eukprot:COSAG05_NODE_719_length_7779_cov_30.552214_6_plen_103_part_00
MTREEGGDVHVCADELHQLVGVGALLGLQVGIVHIVHNARDGLLVVFFRLGGPPLFIGSGKIRFGVHNLVPLFAVIPDACDDDNRRPRILVASGANQQVFNQ